MNAQLEVISSRDNPLIKELRRLAQDGASYRKAGRVWIEGEHLCDAAQARGWKADIAVISDRYLHLAQMGCARSAHKKIVITDALMHSISGLESASGIGLVLSMPPEQGLDAAAHSVIFDRLQDPGNAGSILRSAAAFGFTQILSLKGTVALWSPKVLRSGMGAHFSLRIVEGATVDDLKALAHPLAVTSSHRGHDLHRLQYAAQSLLKREQTSQSISGLEADSASSIGRFNWILGHEGQGVSEALQALAGVQVRIAQPGGQESLNVAAAAAICLHASAAARS